ncbi:MAG: PqqD family protein [Candidatus Bathyarchaeia archaeon]
MSSRKLVKKGSAKRDKEGNLLLVNEEGQAYRVDETAATVWKACEGKTLEELLAEIASSTEREPDDLRGPLENLISSLKEAKLVA